MIIKARPTIYRGIQMRSRLEAKIAGHLDRLKIAWRYEPMCYASGNRQYLPDFQLLSRHRNLFLEVKPNQQQALACAKNPEANIKIIAESVEGAQLVTLWPRGPQDGDDIIEEMMRSGDTLPYDLEIGWAVITGYYRFEHDTEPEWYFAPNTAIFSPCYQCGRYSVWAYGFALPCLSCGIEDVAHMGGWAGLEADAHLTWQDAFAVPEFALVQCEHCGERFTEDLVRWERAFYETTSADDPLPEPWTCPSCGRIGFIPVTLLEGWADE